MKLSRLRGRKINDHVLRKGSMWKGKHLSVRWIAGAPRHPSIDPAKPGVYAGTLISAKTEPSSVKRKRMRRRCREALRVAVKSIPEIPASQLLILPRSSSLTCAFPEIEEDIRKFLSVLTSWHPPRNHGNSSNLR